VRQTSSTVQSADYARGRPDQGADHPDALMRGLIHGVILSIMVWTGVLYLALVLR
jgi:hypothetical protein